MFKKVKMKKSIILISLILSACGGAGNDGNVAAPDNTQQSFELKNIPFIYSGTPVQNQEMTISLQTNESVGEVDWVIDSQPNTENLLLTKGVDNKSITFTPSEPGSYKISIISGSNGTKKSTSFVVSPIFSFDESKIEGNDGSVNLDELISFIKNQSWVYSISLTENELKDVISNYSELTVIGFDKSEGLLVEYDETSISVKEAIEKLKLEKGVVSVEKRTFLGDKADILFYQPDDSTKFNDAGDNWHLESYLEGFKNSKFGANLVDAWEITKGSEDVIIGVSDGGFYPQHEDLIGRIDSILTSKKADHGTGVAGTIGANTNNKVGVSGINHISKMQLASSGKAGYLSLLSSPKVKVINSSWGAMGNGSNLVKGFAHTRKYRKIAKNNSDILHVWAAGNDGANAKVQNGAIHLFNSAKILKLENTIVVAALGSDGALVHYSNYGNTVDIAAQTEFKSPKNILNGVSNYYEGTSYGLHHGGGFNGTSASAPVVTGVASLVYSLYPGFTAKEVKSILIDSSSASVSSRHISHTNDNLESISPIPILNAAKALEKAQKIIDGKVTVTDTIPDPFTSQARVSFKSIDENLEVIGISWELQSSKDSGVTWGYVNSMSVDGDIIEPMLDASTPYQRIVSTVTLRNPDTNDETKATNEYTFSYVTVGINAKDTVSLKSLPDVEVGLELITGLPILTTGSTDSIGVLKAYLKNGTYKVYGSLGGYKNSVTSIFINGLQSLQTTLHMTSDVTGAVGSLGGQVVDSNGSPIAGASVRISGGEQTNGFFASAITGVDGNYVISNISKIDSNKAPITSFILEASASGFSTNLKNEVIVLEGKERFENFILTPQDLTENVIFTSDFEQDITSWSSTGFWNKFDLGNNALFNSLVEGGYTSIAPDESGLQAFLPEAYSGDFAWWYGQENTGSFIGTQSSSDSLLSGGRSTSSNTGQLISPSISLASVSSPFLRFRTWWEIESVNPNESGFDIMDVLISTDNGATYTTLKKLNPFIDPNDSNRESKPFSSGGFNRKPVWVLEEINLSDYMGEDIVIKFEFSTKDSIYNGFRGWIIDDMEVIDLPN